VRVSFDELSIPTVESTIAAIAAEAVRLASSSNNVIVHIGLYSKTENKNWIWAHHKRAERRLAGAIPKAL